MSCMPKLKFCLAGEYPADTSSIGGGVRHVMYMLGETFAERDDIDFHVVTWARGADGVRVVTRPGMTVHYAGERKSCMPGILTLGRTIEPVLRELQPDVVNSHHHITTEAAIRAGCKVVHTIHGVAHKETRYFRGKDKVATFLQGYLQCKVISESDMVTAVAQYGLDSYAKWIKSPTALVGVPVEDMFAEVPPLTESKGVLFAGGIGRRKNLRAAVEAMSAVLKRHPDAVLYVCGGIGDGQYMAELEDLIERQDMKQAVRFLGVVDRNRLAELLGQSVALVLPSYQETLPGVICQAMIAGRVPVVSPVGGVPELVQDGATGYLVEPDDAKSLAARLTELMDDPDKARRMGTAAREIALQRCERHKVANGILEICSSLVNDREEDLVEQPI